MGVTYKLKEDVVAFILQQKKEVPHISCRKLADIIQEAFHISVSKSSINTIIKDANLSNPVGRIPLSDSSKFKFKIPCEKKVQMLRAAKSILDETQILEKKQPNEITPPVVFSKKEMTPPEMENKQEPSVVSEEVAVQLTKPIIDENLAIDLPNVKNENVLVDIGPVENSAEIIQVPLLPDPIYQLVINENPGIKTNILDTNEKDDQTDVVKETVTKIFNIFEIDSLLLRAAMWDLTRRPILETFLKRHTDFSDYEIKILDTLLCFKQSFFDDVGSTLNPDYEWLWLISGFQHVPAIEELQSLLKHIHETNVSDFEFSLELSFIFSFASEVNIFLRDGSVLTFDPRFNIFGKNINNKKLECPLDTAIENVSRFMSDSTMWIIAHCPLFLESFPDLKNMMALSHGVVHKEIEKIVLKNTGGQELMEFSKPPLLRLSILITTVVSLEQLKAVIKQEVTFTTENFINIEQQKFFWTDKDITIQLSTVDLDSLVIRTIIFSKSIHEVDSVIVAIVPVNCRESIECIWNKIPKRLLQTSEDKEFINIIPEDNNYSNYDKPDGCLKDYLLFLKNKVEAYAFKIFIPERQENDVISNNCKVSGYQSINARNIHLFIDDQESILPQEFPHFVETLSAYKISDYDSRKMEVYIK